MKRIIFLFIAFSCFGLTRADGPDSYQRRIVVEELTGTWCAWCIYGMVNMDLAAEQYGDCFIGISVHGGGDGRDPMKDSDYCTAVEKILIRLPRHHAEGSKRQQVPP